MQMITRLIVSLLVLFFLTACETTASKDISHTNEDSHALVITVSLQGQSMIHRFKKLDFTQKSFSKTSFEFNVGKGWSSYLGGEDVWMGIAYNAKKIPAGKYAHVETAHSLIDGGVVVTSQTRLWKCFFDGANVYNFESGHIYILPLERLDEEAKHNKLKDADILKQFNSIRSTYPYIQGMAKIATVSDKIFWAKQPEKSELFTFVSKCKEPISFTSN